jgi:hypothetical protein
MLGDFNVTEDPIDRMPAKVDSNRAIAALREIRHAWRVEDAWRKIYPTERSFTYRALTAGGYTKSRLDRIYIARTLAQMTYDWKVTQTPVPTDHWLVLVKYAPENAPRIGRGRWTLPLRLIENKRFMDEIIERGIAIQNGRNQARDHPSQPAMPSIQMQWETFKADIKQLAKKRSKETHHKINSRITRLEKDRQTLANNPEADTNESLRENEAYIVNELEHLERKRARDNKETLSAALVTHGEKLGGIWSAMSKDKKLRNLIRRLKQPNTTPIQYERDSQKMASLARDYYDSLQREGLNPDDQEFKHRVELMMEEIPEQQKLEDPEASPLMLRTRTADCLP